MKITFAPARLAVLPLALASTWSGAVLAQDTTTLAETVVTASRQPTRADELTSEVVVIERAAIERAAGLSLPELLARSASVQISANGGRGTNSSVFIRGAESRHTLLLIDGVRYGSATSGAPAWENLPLELIERIEVLKGPASALYGADAAAGVVQIFTRRGKQGLAPAAHVTLGSQRLAEVGASVRGGQGALSYALGVSHTDDGSFSATNPGVSMGNHHPDRDPFRQSALNGSLDWQLNPDWSLSAGLVYADGKSQFDDGPGAHARSALRTELLRAGVQGRISTEWKTRFNVSQSSDRSEALESASPWGLPALFETRQQQWSWQNDIATPLGLVVAGLESLEQRVNSSTDYDVNRRRINAAFAGLNGSASGHAWQLNARRDDNSQFGGNSTWYAGYGYQFTPQWRAHASYGTSFVAPSFNQLYWPSYGNPRLQPEEGKNSEIGLDWSQGGHHVKLIRFDNKIRGFITSGVAPVNVPRARIDGWTLGYDGSFGPVTVHASHDALDPRNTLNGRQLQRRAKQQTTLGADYSAGPWRLGANLLKVGRRYDDAANKVALAGYSTLDLYLDYAMAPAWRLQARLNNATDRQYETSKGYNQSGRRLLLTLRYAPQ